MKQRLFFLADGRMFRSAALVLGAVSLMFLCLTVIFQAAVSQAAENSSGKIGKRSDAPSVLPAFSYGQKPADLEKFRCDVKTVGTNDRYEAWSKTLTAPDGKLQITLKGRSYKKFPVLEYSVSLMNLSKTESTDLIGGFRTLSGSTVGNLSASASQAVTLRFLNGSLCRPEDFIPNSEKLLSGKERTFSTPSGRSSNECFPFLELELDAEHGFLFAIGWTGSWSAHFNHQGRKICFDFGMDNTNFKLLPGETIIQPSLTIFKRDNKSRGEFQTTVHRFMLENKAPRDSQGKIIPPILALAAGGGNKTPKMMLDILQYSLDNKMPFDTYWVDAGWYGAPHEDELYSNCGPNWWKYVGDWRVNTTTHPSGTLLPISDAVHKAGMKFLLWFEPERVCEISPVAREHPDYLNANLLDYGNPAALRWIQNAVYGMIEKHKIDVYRQDFNMDPGPVWEGLDKKNPERVGIAEAKHIAGLYTFLDQMKKRFPDILQENCASGGRRIDIEMISRAHSYCRSDYFIGQKPEDKAFILGQNATLNTTPYLPFQGCEFNCVPVGDDYGAFSIISSGTVITPSDFNGGILRRKITDQETKWFKKVFDTAIRMREFYLGDFHPLVAETGAGNDCWCAWQCDRIDGSAGFALAFRRAKSPDATKVLSLADIDPNASYRIDIYNDSSRIVQGSELKNWTVKLDPRSCKLMFYEKIGIIRK